MLGYGEYGGGTVPHRDEIAQDLAPVIHGPGITVLEGIGQVGVRLLEVLVIGSQPPRVVPEVSEQ